MATINNTMLEWSREQAGLSLYEAARRLYIKSSKTATAEEKLLSYESGEREPSRSLLNKMANAYKRPILTFFLSEPPQRTDRGEDFRTLPQHFDPQQNYYVDVLVRDIKARQSIIREALIDQEEVQPLTFIGQSTMEQGVETVASRLTENINISLNEFRNANSYSDAFKYLRQKVEDAGVFVILKGNLGSYHTDIDLEVFRGFVLSDDIAPIIVINHQETKTARAFTLLHELTHLCLGQTGISSSIVEKDIEKFCDRVASEILLPEREFSDFTPPTEDFEDLKESVSLYAQDRRVSSLQVAYRCLQAGKISRETYRQLQDFLYQQLIEARRREKERNQQAAGGPNQNTIRKNYLGGLLNFTQRMNLAGTLSTTKASVVLGVKPLKVQNLYDSANAI